MTLASVLIAAGRAGERLKLADVCEQLKISPQELREDVSVLNVVNFGGGAYVIYAEVLPSGEIEVDPEPYSDTFDRPARLLPIEANALVAAIDLIGRAQADLRSAREKVVDALGFDPVEEGLHIVSPKAEDTITHTVELAVHESRLLEIEYWTQTEDRYSERVVEPYALFNGREALVRRRLGPRRRPAAPLPPGPDQERLGAGRALRAARGAEPDRRHRRLAAHRHDRRLARRAGDDLRRAGALGARAAHRAGRAATGEIVVEITFKGLEFLVREVLKEAGDAVVLEPADAREAVLAAAEGLIARAT